MAQMEYSFQMHCYQAGLMPKFDWTEEVASLGLDHGDLLTNLPLCCKRFPLVSTHRWMKERAEIVFVSLLFIIIIVKEQCFFVDVLSSSYRVSHNLG